MHVRSCTALIAYQRVMTLGDLNHSISKIFRPSINIRNGWN